MRQRLPFSKVGRFAARVEFRVQWHVMKRGVITGLLISSLVSMAFGQSDFAPTGQYPQFRGESGLPGSGFGIDSKGNPNFAGAMAYSTPIAYSLSNWHFSMDAENASDYGFFRLPHLTGHSGKQDSNGKLNFMTGIPLDRFGALTLSYTVLSSLGDAAINFQYQVPYEYRGVAFSFGCQDYRGSVHNAGAEGEPGGNGTSTSYYGVVTAPLPDGIYVSAGYGDRRFKYGFANASIPLGDRFKAVVEHDGFDFNEAIAYHPNIPASFKFFGHQADATIMIGYEKSKYAFWSINLSF
jgi:hypothetical protein